MLSGLKRRLEQVKPYVPALVAFATVLVIILFVSGIPWIFTYLELGKLFSASPAWGFLKPFVLALFVIPAGLVSFLLSAKLGRNRTFMQIVAACFVFSLIVSFSLIFSFSLVFMPQVSHAGQTIDLFVAENSNLSFEEYVNNLILFLDNNVGKAYNTPQANLQIDRLLYGSLSLDPYMMQIWGVTKVDVIVYQGWGSCEEAALLVGELLHRAGYETRQAFFIGIDHQWAEVRHNGTWLIIDPWYLTSNGTLVEAQYLRTLRAEFQEASGVNVQYGNGTWADASQEHGY